MRGRLRFFILAMIWLASLNVLFLLAGSYDSRQEVESKTVAAGKTESQEAIEVSSRIERVIVYPVRAEIVRRGQVNIFPDTRTLVFRGLPAYILPASVRFQASGTARVKILGVELLKEFLASAELPEVKKIQSEISKIEAEIDRIRRQEDVLDSQEKFLNSFGTALSNQTSKELLAGRADLAGIDKFVDYLGARLQSIQNKREEYASLKAEKQARLEALRKKLKEIMPERPREQSLINVLIETAETAQLQFELSYSVYPAGWRPVYTVRALPESGEIELTVGAIVYQKTGENWENVRLTLSTVRQTAENQPGELPPWYLDVVQLQAAKALKAERMMTEEAVPGAVIGGVLGGRVTAVEEKAITEESWFSTSFEIKKPWTILSDGAERRVPVDSNKLQASFDYLSIPKLQERVFLRSSFLNRLSYPLLKGKADMFIDRDFVGTSAIPDIPVNEETQLFFGEDNQVRIKRELVKREKSPPGFLGKNEKITQAFKITLENLRQRPVEVEVQDQIPVSQHSRIEVKDVKINPAPASRQENGIFCWKIKLAARQKQELSFEFTVEYPKDLRVSGI